MMIISEIKPKSWDFFSELKVPRFDHRKFALKWPFLLCRFKTKIPEIVEFQGFALFYFLNLLSHQDSNLGKLNQNQMCYHYTMGQSYAF